MRVKQPADFVGDRQEDLGRVATAVANAQNRGVLGASRDELASRSCCSAGVLAIAVAANSMKSAMRDSVPAGNSSREVAATATPQ